MKILRSKFIHILQYIGERHKIKILPDKLYLKLLYYHKVGDKLNLNHPKSFTEKIQWLKLNDHKDIYSIMADKYAVKAYICKLLGEDITIPTIGVFNKFEEIPFGKLPDSFVIKCTHDWNSIIICRNKRDLDMRFVKKNISKALRRNHYYRSLEWAYKNIPPQIIIEPFLSVNGETAPIDYRVYCFNGKPYFIHITIDKFTNRKVIFLDTNWEIIPIQREGLVISTTSIKKPTQFNKMLDAASKISQNIPFLRVDFYIIKEQLFLGECTFYPAEGFKVFYPHEWNYKLGKLVKLQ